MEPTNWAPGHSDALRELLARGLSFAAAAAALNSRFHTTYSRSATLGRARRMGLAAPNSPNAPLRVLPRGKITAQPGRSGKSGLPEFHWPLPVFERTEPLKLRCAGIEPRHLSLDELARSDCRYPYGGDEDGEAITFCGHPRREGSSYCTPHFHLSRGPGTASERAAIAVVLRAIEAA